jgi:serine/threonine protein kinase
VCRSSNVVLGSARIGKMVGCILSSIDFLNRGGYVHMDVKPENVLVRTDGTCLLIDMEFAYNLHVAERGALPMVGTREFLAPEMMQTPRYPPDRPELTYKSDVYSTGRVLRELIHHDAAVSGSRVCDLMSSCRLYTELSVIYSECTTVSAQRRPFAHQVLSAHHALLQVAPGPRESPIAVLVKTCPRATSSREAVTLLRSLELPQNLAAKIHLSDICLAVELANWISSNPRYSLPQPRRFISLICVWMALSVSGRCSSDVFCSLMEACSLLGTDAWEAIQELVGDMLCAFHGLEVMDPPSLINPANTMTR